MRLRLNLLIAGLVVISGSAGAVDWRPVTSSELAQRTPRVDPAADAEAIFWDVRLEDRVTGSDLSLAMNHYVRIKIFTDRGKEKYSTVEIEEIGKRSISEIAGRTIKPDGTILELKKDSIFDRELAKTRGFKVRGKAFALPNVEVGDIIEYRYKETHDNESASHMRLYFQRDIPMWNVTYHVKPLNIPYFPFQMRSMSFQLNPPPVQKEPNGFYSVSASNMPSFQEEPSMPPEDQLRAWMLIYYEEDRKIDAEKYWKEIGRDDFRSFKPRMAVTADVKRIAAELVSGASRPEDQLAQLDLYCRTKINNLSENESRMTAEQLKVFKENHSPVDTLKQKAGWGLEVDLLFAALANAAGFDARMVRISDRSDTFFTPARPLTYFIRNFSVAVKVNDKWLFYDPSTPYLGRGMLRWQEEGQQALISDSKEGFFVETPNSQPSRSLRQRRANFKLHEDGSLEGTVQYTFTGHVAREEKTRYEDLTPPKREEEWKKGLQARINKAEVTELEMQNLGDPLKPMIVQHKLTVPGYATRTGKRILFEPAFFQYNLPARFTDTKRKWPLYFDYGWAEDDEVTIELPEGWEIDQPVGPKGAKLGDVGIYNVELRKTLDGRKLIYRRQFDFGRDGKLLLPAEVYPQFKSVFDYLQQQDNYTIALKAVADAK